MLTIGSDSMGGRLMRGRRPEKLTIARRDEDALHAAAHSGSLPWFQVRRAKIVLAIAAGERQCSVAARLECDEATVWRTCQRYRQGGLATLFADRRQGHSGRPQQITPVQRAQIVELACLEPIAKGLHITHWSSEDLARQAVADGIVARDQPGHGSPHLARRRSATPSHPLLEDGSAGRPVQGEGGASPLVLCQCGSACRTGHLGGVRR